ncbi:uncharacterized protein LOC134209450 [Armigeres subalbatus]|uniref:uncharacterized protein LOC134209450 n=1 Tax=Armigeres subalbatus TaxID=124917 RepID=UPI002ED627E3
MRTIQDHTGLFEFTVEQLKIKWANLTRKYKLLITPPTGGATENGETTPGDWEYFDLLHEFMSSQHTINPPIVINSCGIVVENSNNNFPNDDELHVAGPSNVNPDGSNVSSPETATQSPESMAEQSNRKRKRNRYTQQDMFEFFVEESKRKKKEGRKFFTLLKSIAGAQNIELPNMDSSSSDSEPDF